jgi:hypothetical protein
VDEKCFVGKVRHDAKSLVAYLHPTLFSPTCSSGIYCKRTKSEIPESGERRAGVAIGSLIIGKIAEFAKPVDLAENTVYDPRANYRAPQATIKTPPET